LDLRGLLLRRETEEEGIKGEGRGTHNKVGGIGVEKEGGVGGWIENGRWRVDQTFKKNFID